MSFASIDFSTEERVWKQICAEVLREPHQAMLKGKRVVAEVRKKSSSPDLPDEIIPEQIAHLFYVKLMRAPHYRAMGKVFEPIGDDPARAASLRAELVTWYARIKRERAEQRHGVS